MARKFTFYSQSGWFFARTFSGVLVKIPSQVFADQKGYDGQTFPVLRASNDKPARAMLRGDLYGLHTAGTGDPIVAIV